MRRYALYRVPILVTYGPALLCIWVLRLDESMYVVCEVHILQLLNKRSGERRCVAQLIFHSRVESDRQPREGMNHSS